MRIIILFALAFIAIGCGDQSQVVNDAPPKANLTPPASTVCDTVNFDFCETSPQTETRGNISNTAILGLYAKFEPTIAVSNLFGRLVELGGHQGPGGGAALVVTGSGGGLSVECAWWDMSLNAASISDAISDGEHSVYCEIDQNGGTLYIDGVLNNTHATAYTPTTGVLGIGEAAYSNSFDFKGSIAAVGVTTSHKTQSDIEAMQ